MWRGFIPVWAVAVRAGVWVSLAAGADAVGVVPLAVAKMTSRRRPGAGGACRARRDDRGGKPPRRSIFLARYASLCPPPSRRTWSTCRRAVAASSRTASQSAVWISGRGASHEPPTARTSGSVR